MALGNMSVGLSISDGASSNTIGGTSSIASNIISGNSGDGVDIDGSGTSANVVVENFVGTDPNIDAGLGNSVVAAPMLDDASDNTIGGTTSGMPTSSRAMWETALISMAWIRRAI